jgi:hypothetical protein
MMHDRPPDEISRCQSDGLVLRFSEHRTPQGGNYSDFWAMAKDLQQQDPNEWVFSHCLPWEYAQLCAQLYQANEAHTGRASSDLPADVIYELVRITSVGFPDGIPWYPTACYPFNTLGKPYLTYEHWRNLSASPSEIRQSSIDHLVPRRLEEHADLALWVLTYVVCNAKTLDNNEDAVSMHLYHHVHYVYQFSIGESSLIEIITIIILNFFLFCSSFLLEIQQLMHQVDMTCGMRCYEGALFGKGIDAESFALRRAVRRVQETETRYDNISLFANLVASDFLCDIFLALRIIFVAELVASCSMFVTMNHGVINVIFSVLAVAFLMDIDDRLMQILQNFGFKTSALYQHRLEPALIMRLQDEEDALVESRLARAESVPNVGGVKGLLLGRVRALAGQPIRKWWSALLTFTLLGFELYWCVVIASDATPENMSSVLSEVFNEFIGDIPTVATLAIGVVYVAIFLNSLCFNGLIALPQLIQTLLCLIWVYGFNRNVIMLGILAWYADVPPGYTFLETVSANMSQQSEALWIRPAFALHLLFVVVRPLLLLVHTFASVADPSVHPSHGESSPVMDPAIASIYKAASGECQVEPEVVLERASQLPASVRGRNLNLRDQGISESDGP